MPATCSRSRPPRPRRRPGALPLAVLLFAVLQFGATACVGGPVPAALDELLADPALAGGRVGVMVVDTVDGAVLAQAMHDRGFATASNMKLVTAAVALESMGPEHVFVTTLAACGAIAEGELRGDLVLRGGGDPSFAEPRADGEPWTAMAARLHDAGVRRVAGRVVGDASILPPVQRGHGWQWDYLADDYAAPFAGLVAAGSVLEVRVAAVDGAVQVTTSPPLPTLDGWVDSRAVTVVGDGKTELAAARGLGTQLVVLSGKVVAGAEPATLRVAVADPVRFAEAVATAALRGHGVEVVGAPQSCDGPEEPLAWLSSRPLRAIVQPMLTRSDNLYAEMLFRMSSRLAGDAPEAGGTEAAERHAKAALGGLGVACDGMVLADGSGLSRRNLVQPRQLVQLLRAARERSWFDAFEDGLPVAGETGTLRSRFADGPAKGHVHAKTGFISRVVCLSGYVERPAGAPLVFSVMLNDFTCDTDAAKAACDRFVQRLAAFAGW